ncbi:MAG: thioredoxin fold domain-containing protein [Chromatiales bacterium]|nr:thioredoxin fold domain-containing protein [Chromatiales bacterium]
MLLPTRLFAVVLATLAAAVPAVAADPPPALSPQAAIAGSIPGVSPEQVSPSPIAGLYEVRLGSKIAYVSGDGRYLLQGEIIDLTTDENLTEARREGLRRAVLATVDEGSMIVFAPARYTDTITVFTDVDCGYCRKLHRQVAEYNARGIRVRYMAFPRSGPGTASWKEAEKVWCSADRRTALTKAKLGEKLTAPDCKPTMIAQHFNIGRDFGLQGTPAIVLESGELIGGYLEPAELAKYIAETRAPGKVSMR